MVTSLDKQSLKQPKKQMQQSTYLKQGEVLIGFIQGISDKGQPEVTYSVDANVYSAEAMATLPVSMAHMGRNVVLSFIEGDIKRPIIMGFLWQPDLNQNKKDVDKTSQDQFSESHFLQEGATSPLNDVELIRAHDRIEIKCGQASITLTHTGKILFRGETISSRAKGTHRIKGGSVQIN